jgi:hypothetical protein
MRRLSTLTLLALLAINCSGTYPGPHASSRGYTLTYGVGTQAELDAANQRILQFKQELLQQGFQQVSDVFSNSSERFELEGKYGSLEDLRVTLWTGGKLEEDKPELGGGIHANLRDEKAEQEFEELYKKVVRVVTGRDS